MNAVGEVYLERGLTVVYHATVRWQNGGGTDKGYAAGATPGATSVTTATAPHAVIQRRRRRDSDFMLEVLSTAWFPKAGLTPVTLRHHNRAPSASGPADVPGSAVAVPSNDNSAMTATNSTDSVLHGSSGGIGDIR
jgi:hypothetical protein